jgi:Glycosyltransferase family 87
VGIVKMFDGRARYLWAAAMTWILTRALMVSELGYLRAGTKIEYQDVNVFQNWADRIFSTRLVPGEPAWQYPAGAVLVFLVPRVAPGHYGAAFVSLILVADAMTTVALVVLGRRYGTAAGAWLWLLVLPMLGTLPLLRFDVIPTCIAVVALALAATAGARRFGFVVGVGAAVKAWPVLLLLAVSNRRNGRTSTIVAAVTTAIIAAVGWLALPNSLDFLIHQGGRGLELEAVAATPWYLRQAITGQAVQWVGRNGSLEIVSPKADLLSHGLVGGMLLVGVALIIWWIKWTRGMAEGADEVGRVEVGRDMAFTAVLLFVVVSEVLSPQYLIWLVGMGAVAIASPRCRVRRPVAAVVVAVIVTRALLATWGDLVSNGSSGAYLLCIRNGILVFAAVDAAVTMFRVLSDARHRPAGLLRQGTMIAENPTADSAAL